MAKYNTRHANKRTQRNVNSKKPLQGACATGSDDENSTSLETNRKRKVSKAFVESEKEVKRYKNATNNHDRFCWKCHKIDAEIGCSTCLRSFHSYCAKAKINDNGSCYVCQQESVAKTDSSIEEEIDLSKLLLHIIDIACPINREEYKPIVNWPDSKENEKLICKKDFGLIYDRCVGKGIPYESHLELVNEVKWIHHNCIIIYGDKSPNVKMAKKVLDAITLELNDATNCPECYSKKMSNENESLAFLHICKTPHPLVWAKVKGWPFWPAKCLKVTDGKNGKANVKFFHTHQMSSLPLTKVLALSKAHPSKSYQKSVDLELALSRLTAYIDIFEEHYGPFPYEPVDTPFDFKKEEQALRNILKNRKKRRILSGDSFILSTKNDVNPPAIVDLTDDVNDENQQSHGVASPINDSQLCGQVHVEPQNDDDEDFLDNTRSTIDANNSVHNAQSIIAIVENDPELKSGLQNSVKAFQAEISGNLLPGHHSQNSADHQNLTWFSQPTGISISNVVSGTDVSLDSNSELLVPAAHCEAEPALQNNFGISMPSVEPDPFQTTSVFSQNSISPSNSMQLCLRNFDRTSENVGYNAIQSVHPVEDSDIEILDEVSSHNDEPKRKKSETECLLQAIIRHDPETFSILKEANTLGQQLFIKFWANRCKLAAPEKLVLKQESEIRRLKLQLDEKDKQISHLTNDYEDRLQNADKVLKSLKAEVNILSQKLKEKEEMLEQQNKEVKSIIEKNEKQCEERVREAKTIKFCNKNKCTRHAKIPCCHSGIYSYAYCSEICKNTDDIHKEVCKSKQNQCKGEEEISSPMGISSGIVQQSATMIIKETRSLQCQISNKEVASTSTPHQNMKFNKFVSAKKTVEVARNINRASSDMY